MNTKKLTLDDLIDELIDAGKIDELIEQIELEGLHIDPDVQFFKRKTPTPVSKELYDIPIKDKEYELSMDWMLLENKKLFVEINFRLKNLKQLKNLKSSNSTLETGLTKTGDAKMVFDMVVSASIKLINERRPDYITFQAREENRQRTYKYMIKQVLRKIGNTYKEITISPLTGNTVESDEFWLEKI